MPVERSGWPGLMGSCVAVTSRLVALCIGAAMVSAAWLELAAWFALIACASCSLNIAHAKRVASSEVVMTEACALFALRAAALDLRTFFLIEGSGLLNLDAMVNVPQELAMLLSQV
jgi:hypothetical protein